jgi:hypothetical protein
MLSKELGPSAGCRLRDKSQTSLLDTAANCHPLMTGEDDRSVNYDQDKPSQVMASAKQQSRAPPPNGLKPLAVTFKTGSQITGLGLTTLWKLAKAKRIETVSILRRTLIVYASLERLILGAEPRPLGGPLVPRRRGRTPKKPRKSDSPVTISNSPDTDAVLDSAAINRGT